MKAKIVLGLLVAVLGTALGVTAAPGEPVVKLQSGSGNCVAGKSCLVNTPAPSGDPQPICRPGIPCTQTNQQ